MGAEPDLPEGEHEPLAQCIEILAQTFAFQLIHRLSDPKDLAQGPANNDPDLRCACIGQSESRSVGAEHLMLQMARQLQLSKEFQELGLSKTDTAVAPL